MLTSEVHVNTSTFRREGFRKLKAAKMSRRSVKHLLFLLLFLSATVASYLVFYVQRDPPENGYGKMWSEKVHNMKIEPDRAVLHSQYGVQDKKQRIETDKIVPQERHNLVRPTNQLEEPPAKIAVVIPIQTTLPADEPDFLESIKEKAKDLIIGKDEDDTYRNKIKWGLEPADAFKAREDGLSDKNVDAFKHNIENYVNAEKKKGNEHNTIPDEYLFTNSFGEVIGEHLFDGGMHSNIFKHKKQTKVGVQFVDKRNHDDNGMFSLLNAPAPRQRPEERHNIRPMPDGRHEIERRPHLHDDWENNEMNNVNPVKGHEINKGESLGHILRPFGANGFNPFLGNRDTQRKSREKSKGHRIGEGPNDGLEAFDLNPDIENKWRDSPFEDRDDQERDKPGDKKYASYGLRNSNDESKNNVGSGELEKDYKKYVPYAVRHGLRQVPNVNEQEEIANAQRNAKEAWKASGALVRTLSQEEFRQKFELQQRNEENRKEQERLKKLFLLQNKEHRIAGQYQNDATKRSELQQQQKQELHSNDVFMATSKSSGQERLHIEDLNKVIPVHANCVEFNFPTGPAPLCLHSVDRDEMSAAIVKDGFYEPEIMREFTAIMYQDDNLGFVDIGAGIGIYTIAAALMERSVLAVEPLFRNYRLMRKTAQGNKVASKIVLVTEALDNVSYVGHMTYSEKSGGYTKVKITHLLPGVQQDSASTVHVTTLDNLTIAAPMTHALMKLDVNEGFEHKILQGGSTFFDVIHVPYILTHWSQSTDPALHMTLFSCLSHLGYKAKLAWNGADVNIDHLKNDLSYLVWKKKV